MKRQATTVFAWLAAIMFVAGCANGTNDNPSAEKPGAPNGRTIRVTTTTMMIADKASDFIRGKEGLVSADVSAASS